MVQRKYLPIDKIIGKRVRVARENIGMSLVELGKQSKISIAQLSRLERGDHNWKANNIVRVAAALDIPASVLLIDKGVQVSYDGKAYSFK